MDGILQEAQRIRDSVTSWVIFYKHVFGPEGVIRSRLPCDQLDAYRQTDEYAELIEMLADLRSTDLGKQTTYESEQMITIRVPVSLHSVLVAESDEAQLSLQKLAITKLMQPTDPRFQPIPNGRRRGRRSKLSTTR